MKLNRRKLFAVGAGAAAAGPDVVRSVATERAAVQGGMTLGGALQADPQWTARELARAKRMAAGNFEDGDACYPTDGAGRFEALRSVSREARVYLNNRRYEQQWRERTMKSAREALEQYDKTGILRHFL